MYVYWIYNEKTTYSKIGITKDYERRLSEIENSTGCELWTIWVLEMESKRAVDVETFLHSILGAFRTKGEWFEISRGLSGYLYNLFTAYTGTFQFPEGSGNKTSHTLFCTTYWHDIENYMHAYNEPFYRSGRAQQTVAAHASN